MIFFLILKLIHVLIVTGEGMLLSRNTVFGLIRICGIFKCSINSTSLIFDGHLIVFLSCGSFKYLF